VTALAFLSPSPGSAELCSPLATRFDGMQDVVDRSLIRKLELHAPATGRFGSASRVDGAWWCPVTPGRTLVLGGSGVVEGDVVDMTCAYAAVEIGGPRVLDWVARFCALDLRPAVLPVGGFRPGSVARTPGYVLRVAEEALLLLVGAAYAGYVADVVIEARRALDA
jgi:hypothetical protein